MSKIRIKIEAILEFEPNPEWYNDDATLEDILAVELSNAQDDTILYVENNSTQWSFSGEIIN